MLRLTSFECGCLKVAIEKSCFHMNVKVALDHVERLTLAGYPKYFLLSLASSLLEKLKSSSGMMKWKRGKPYAHIMPYLDRVSHNIKKDSARHSISMVSLALGKYPCCLPNLTNAQKGASSSGGQQKLHSHSEDPVFAMHQKCGLRNSLLMWQVLHRANRQVPQC